jgi:hypothetical protein
MLMKTAIMIAASPLLVLISAILAGGSFRGDGTEIGLIDGQGNGGEGRTRMN